jgi:hypothetical protein
MRILNAPIRFALVAAVALVAGGCRIDLTIDDKGGGSGDIAYHIQKAWELDGQKKNLESANVKVTSAAVDSDKLASFKIVFDDVTKLPTTQFFKSVVLTRAVENGVVKVTAKVSPANPIKLPESGVKYFGPDVTISVSVPGTIVDSNAKSTQGKTATWVFPINDLLSAKDLPLTLSYKQGS